MALFRKLATAALFLVSMAPAVQAACTLTPDRILETSPYFSENMTVHPEAPDTNQYSITLQHKDDPRILATFSISSAPSIGEVSRSDYVKLLEAQAREFVGGVNRQGRWAEYSVFPYDPVATRIIEKDNVGGGLSNAGRLTVRFTPECQFSAAYVAPDSINLRSRWVELDTKISSLRDRARFLSESENWLPDDTTPIGATALGIGFGVPVVVMAMLFFLMGHMRELDVPNVWTKIVMICSAIVGAGVIGLQYPLYQEGFAELRYVDNLILMATLVIISLAGPFGGTAASLLAFVASCVVGVTLSVNSYLDWTPLPDITSIAGIALILMGVFGFYAWSYGVGGTFVIQRKK